MFEKQTTFILGAGASWHYSYPTGEQLVKRIVEKADRIIACLEHEQDKILSPNSLPNFFKEKIPYNDDPRNTYPYIFECLNIFNNFRERVLAVDPPVIDYFLGWNDDLRDIGRFLISWVILDSEREHAQYAGNNNRRRALEESHFHEQRRINRLDNFPDNWYRFILYKIVSGCHDHNDVCEKNKVNFITFNYDTSLEKFLHTGLQSIRFMNGDNSYINKFLKDRFIHVYGSIRNDPYGNSKIIEAPPSKITLHAYTDILNYAYEASKGIRTIDPDDKEDLEILRKAKDLLMTSQEVFILGYGFDSNNNERLGLKEAISRKGLRNIASKKREGVKKKIFFTNYGDKNSINKRVGKLLVDDPARFLQDQSKIFTESLSSGAEGGGLYQFHYEKSTKDVYSAIEEDFDFV